jgi:hypothetical protein
VSTATGKLDDLTLSAYRHVISTIMRDLGATSRFPGGAAGQRERLI